MSTSTELALAARRVRRYWDEIPESARPQHVVDGWRRMRATVEAAGDGAKARKAIDDYLKWAEPALIGTLANAPLNDRGQR